MAVSLAEVWRILDEVKDPEIPVVSVVEMGLIRTLGIEGGSLVVVMTPTFAGCPALALIQSEIAHHLGQAGYENVSVRISLSPGWTTDWISPRGREKLRGFGLAPPPRHGGDLEAALEQAAICPYCGSKETSLKNSFGPTLCRAIYFCNACQQPFEQFKPI